MEEEKKEAYAILVKGIEIGKAAVIAELVDQGHPVSFLSLQAL